MQVKIKSKFSLLMLSLSLVVSGATYAEMQSLSDKDLSEVDGQGIGLVMDDFVFSHGHDTANDKVFRITGVTNKNGDPVTINVNQMYIARSGSNYGADLKGVNLGRLDNPYEFDLIDGDNIGLAGKSVLEFKAPEKVQDTLQGFDCLTGAAGGECSSRAETAEWRGERPDIGLELEINEGGESSNLNFNVSSAVFDGSYLRLWGDDDNKQMAAEFRLNFYTPQLEISTCAQSNQGCSSSIKMQDFQVELALGNTFQPLYIGVDNVSGGLTLEVAKITHQYIDNIDLTTGLSDGGQDGQGDAAYTFFEDYYTNEQYRSNIVVGNLDIGGTSLGESKIEGILIQYLDVKFRDLDSN
jgi:hypothetical protein